MLVGYNTNVPYKGKLYHVQTEDNGINNPIIVTLLYIKGTILASKKVSYAEIASSPDYKEKVRELMKDQHKNMIKELIRGTHTPGDTPETPAEKSGAEESGPKITEPEKPEPVAAEQPTEQPAAQQAGDAKQISKSLDDILLDYIIREGD